MPKQKHQVQNSIPVNSGDSQPKSRLPFPLAAVFFLFLVLGTVIYLPSFHASFHFDDLMNYLQNESFQDPFDVAEIWQAGKRRFFSQWSLAWNYHFSGESVFSYHVVNFLIHWVSSLLCFFLIRQTFDTPAMSTSPLRKDAEWIALFGGLVFLCHPIQTQAVTYIVQRHASMAALFYLATLLLASKAALSKHKGWYAAAVLTCFVAIFSKENAYTLPMAVALYYACFFGIKKKDLDQYLFNFIPFLIPVAIIFLLAFQPQFQTKGLTAANSVLSTTSHGEYLLTQFNVVRTYLRLLILPIGQTLDYDYQIAKTLIEFPTFPSFILLCVLLGYAIRLYKNHRLIAFGIFFFFLSLSIESGLVNIPDVIYEHRLYLPITGFIMSAVCAAFYLIPNKKILLLVGAFVITTFSGMTYARNGVWKNPATLWEDVVKKAPNKARTNLGAGNAYLEMANQTQDNQALLQKAAEYTEKALKLDGGSAKTHNNLGIIYARQGKLEEAISQFKTAIRMDPKYQAPKHNLTSTQRILNEPPALREKSIQDLNVVMREKTSKFERGDLSDLGSKKAPITDQEVTSSPQLSTQIGGLIGSKAILIMDNVTPEGKPTPSTTYSLKYDLDRQNLIVMPVSTEGNILPSSVFKLVDKKTGHSQRLDSILDADGSLNVKALISLRKQKTAV